MARGNRFTFHAGMGHVPTDLSRRDVTQPQPNTIEAHVEIDEAGAEGVLIAHGDATSGYSLYVKDGHLVHDLNIGGGHEIVTSDRKIVAGAHRLGVRVERLRRGRERAGQGRRPHRRVRLYTSDRRRARGPATDRARIPHVDLLVGLDIGRDRGSAVSALRDAVRIPREGSRASPS